MKFDLDRGAQLVASIYRPEKTSVAACLDRWQQLTGSAREACYLVVDGERAGVRHTLNAREIARLVERHAEG